MASHGVSPLSGRSGTNNPQVWLRGSCLWLTRPWQQRNQGSVQAQLLFSPPAVLILFFAVPFVLGLVLDQAGSCLIQALTELLFDAPLIDGALHQRHVQVSNSQVAPLFLKSDALPLRTKGRWIIDSQGRQVRLHCVNWYGSHMEDLVPGGLERRSLRSLAFTVRALGFNCVRLPYSLQLQLAGQKPRADAVQANPELMNYSGLEILDATVSALANAEVMIVLNNHQGRAMWCCSEDDGEGLWYSQNYPEQVWLESLRRLAHRYRSQPFVIGYDLRNEPRGVPTHKGGIVRPHWAKQGGHEAFDWAGAALRGGLAVTEKAPDALIVVEGLDFAQDLSGLGQPQPRGQVHLHQALLGRVVYEVHDYCWYHPEFLHAWQLYWLYLGWSCCLLFELLRRQKWPTLHQFMHRFPFRICLVLTILTAGYSNWLSSYSHFVADLEHKWGFLIHTDEAPVWLGEFGTNGFWVTADWPKEVGEVTWLKHMLRYIRENELPYAYWALNGEKIIGEEETFGLLHSDYQSLRQPYLLKLLTGRSSDDYCPESLSEEERSKRLCSKQDVEM